MRTQGADGGCANGGGDVVVGRGDVGGQRAQRVEGRLAAPVQLLLHVLGDLVQRDVPRALVHHLEKQPVCEKIWAMALHCANATGLWHHLQLLMQALVSSVGISIPPSSWFLLKAYMAPPQLDQAILMFTVQQMSR